MLSFVGRRILQIIPLLVAISIIVFVIIQLPPGDYLTTYIQQLEMTGTEVSEAQIQLLKNQYHLDKPLYQQYFYWITNILFRGNFGLSFLYNRPVSEVIGERMALTIAISLMTLIFTWLVAVPIGIFSATHQYSVWDYFFTFLGFIGVSVPGFLIALVIVYAIFSKTGVAITGLFSPEYVTAPWGLPKILDMLKHVWLPIIIIGLSGTAGLIRTVRGMMLDELGKQYVITARAKGVPEKRLLFKYPIRVAVNPIISTIGWLLPSIISGESLVSIVLNIQTMGPVLMKALLSQDMYLAGSFLLITSTLTVIGTLISDILLAWLDPRIRFGGVAEET